MVYFQIRPIKKNCINVYISRIVTKIISGGVSIFLKSKFMVRITGLQDFTNISQYSYQKFKKISIFRNLYFEEIYSRVYNRGRIKNFKDLLRIKIRFCILVKKKKERNHEIPLFTSMEMVNGSKWYDSYIKFNAS